MNAVQNGLDKPSTRLLLALLLLSAATLAFEISLTRIFSVSQFYHFAFMIVSLALLGYGASGTILAVFPNFGKHDMKHSLAWIALLGGYSILGAYLLTNWIPFDSFSITWDYRQVLILVVHYLALSTPFFCIGLAVGLLLSKYPRYVQRIYAANMVGSASGCALALITPSSIGAEGTVAFCSGLGAFAAAIASQQVMRLWSGEISSGKKSKRRPRIHYLSILSYLLMLFVSFDYASRLSGDSLFPFMEIRLSPYKSYSYAKQYPDARLIAQDWNAYSRVDVVRSTGIRSLPGLSYRYQYPPPAMDGVLVDGEDMSGIVLSGAKLDFTAYLPASIAYRLRPDANTLVLEPRGGLDIITALAGGAHTVTAVEVNSLIIKAASHIYDQPKVKVVVDADRSFIQRTHEQYDVVTLSLTSSYHPVSSGAYSLAEDYRYTVEAFQDDLRLLKPQGIFVVMRWLQLPPSESLKAFALAVTALEGSGLDPGQNIVAFRGYNVICLLVKNDPFTQEELHSIRSFTNQQKFDLVYAPDILPEETNQYNILPESVYYQNFMGLLNSTPREQFYKEYPYDVSPPTDDHPFFAHFFKWSQARQILIELGKTWQPFGGAGYFVIIVMLFLVTIFAVVLVLLPVITQKRVKNVAKNGYTLRRFLPALLYFTWIGFAYLMVEIPLIQHFILYLGHPAYAVTAVIFSLLLFSGLGSWWGNLFRLQWMLLFLVGILVGMPFLLPVLFRISLGLAFPLRLLITILMLAPLGFLMGMPFPLGLSWFLKSKQHDILIPWVWGTNGAASVVSAVLAALIALSFGFSWVLWLGALFYFAAFLSIREKVGDYSVRYLHQ